jgi:hypothetical protein
MVREQEVPGTLEEAKVAYEEQLEIMQDIQAQLGTRNKRHPDDTRFTAEEYWDWHQKAKIKLRHVTARVRYLKQFINEGKNDMRDAIEVYASHLDDCTWWDKDEVCDCGLDPLLKKFGLPLQQQCEAAEAED